MNFDAWITWALQGLVVGVIGLIWKNIQENTKITTRVTTDLGDLRLELHKYFVMKEEWTEVRRRLHDIENYIAGQRAIVDLAHLRAEDARKSKETS